MRQHPMRQRVHNGKQNRLSFCPQNKKVILFREREIKTRKYSSQSTTASSEKCAEERSSFYEKH